MHHPATSRIVSSLERDRKRLADATYRNDKMRMRMIKGIGTGDAMVQIRRQLNWIWWGVWKEDNHSYDNGDKGCDDCERDDGSLSSLPLDLLEDLLLPSLRHQQHPAIHKESSLQAIIPFWVE